MRAGERRLRAWTVVLCGLWLALGAYAVSRLAWSFRRQVPSLPVGAALEVRLPWFEDEASLGPIDGARLLRVNGEPAENQRSLSELSGSGRPWTDLEVAVAGTAEPQTWRWVYRRRPPAIEVDEDLVLTAPVADLGLASGDRVHAVNGVPLTDRADLERRLNGFEELTLRLSTESPRREVLLYRVDWRARWAIVVAAILFGAIGLVTLWLAPSSRSSWGFAAFCLFNTAFGAVRAVPHAFRLPEEKIGFLILTCLWPAAAAVHTFTYVTGRARPERVRRALAAAVVAGAILMALAWLLDAESAAEGQLARPLRIVWMSGITLALVVPLFAVMAGRRGQVAKIDRLRFWVFCIASLAAFAPMGIYEVTKSALSGRGVELRLPFDVAVLLFPLVIAWAIVRRNLLRLDRLLHEGLVFGAVAGLLALTYAALVGMTVPLAERLLPDAGSWIAGAAIGLVALLALPVHTRARRWIEARFERGDSTLVTIVDPPDGGDLTSLGAYFDALVRWLSRQTRSYPALLVLRHPVTDALFLAATTSETGRGPTAEACRPLLDALIDDRSTRLRDTFGESVWSDADPAGVLASFRELEAAVAAPVVVGGDVWGLVGLGDRRGLAGHGPRDLEALGRTARLCAAALYRHTVGAPLRSLSTGTRRRIVDLYPECPERIGPYSVRGLIGEGGMALVFLAERDGREFAVKVANTRVLEDTHLLRRFQREVETLRQVRHPHVVEILDAGEDNGEPYLVMEYFARGSLADVLRDRERGLEESEARGFAVQVATGLKAALARDVIHRDVKPRNVFVAAGGELKVGDFGIARLEGRTTLTTHTGMIGTPAYLSPESCAGRRVSWKSDQYALGVVLFEMLTGQRPFAGQRVAEIIAKHLFQKPPRADEVEPRVSRGAADVVATMLAKDPERRFASYDELIVSLEAA